MVDEKLEGKEIGKSIQPAELPSAGGKKIGGSKLPKIFNDLRNIFSNSGKKDNKAESVVAFPGRKKSILEALNVQRFDLKFINQIFALVILGLIGLTFYVLFQKKPDISSVKAAVSKIKFVDVESEKITEFQKEDYYLKEAEKRDIFNIFTEKKEEIPVAQVEEEEAPPEPVAPPKVPIEDKAKGLKLIGISWGDHPKAMIQDSGTNEVQFLSEGEMIPGRDIRIEEVLKTEVILSSEDDTMSLM